MAISTERAGLVNFPPMPRIHILGASGSGTTTLGRALSAATGWPHEDSDTYFWVPTDPPFTTPRPPERRLDALLPRLSATADWIFTGSAISWAKPLEPLYELVVYLHLDPALRMARLHARESARYGARILPGGDMAQGSQEFIAWAAAYDTAGPEQRSRVLHAAWLAARACPVLRLDATAPVERLVASVLAAVSPG